MLKAYFRLVSAALTAAALLAGCAKEKVNGQAATEPAVQAEGSRTIAVSFAPQTKTALRKDGLTPEFQPGDSIMVAMKDGSSQPEVCIVTMDTVITTNLKGDLVAVYPSSAAKLNENTIEGVCVSPKQTGKFADANICTAYISAGSKTANFKNETAILKFYVDKSIGVKSITIENTEYIADNSTSITVDGTDEKSILSEITKETSNETSNERICYVAVLAGSHSALQFTSETSTQSAPVQKQLPQATNLAAGTMYNVFLPYYIQVGDQKWAYCNLGAFLPEEPGYYFSWGNTEGFIRRYNETTENSEWIYPSGESAPAGGFTDDNYSKTAGYSITVNLTAENDAATVAWHGDWRMPTKSEFETLCSLKPEWKAYRDGTQYGQLVGDLFFPAVGRGIYEQLEYPNEKSYYWSSTIETNPYYFHFTSSDLEVDNGLSRSQGFSIRPICGTSAPKLMPEILPGVFTVGPGNDKTFGNDDDVKVNFLRGNLWWQGSNNSWHIEDHQYDVPETYNREHLGLFYYFGDATVSNYGTNDLTQIKKEDTDETIRENYGACYKYYASNADWGKAYSKGHTLTYDEWGYLLSFDKNKSQYLVNDDPGEEDLKLAKDYSNVVRTGRYKEKVEVVGHIGMLLVPDDWDLTKNPLDKTSYSATEWAAAEANGAVFLPYVRGYAFDGQMHIMPSQEYYEEYMKMVEEKKLENPTEEIPEYSDMILPYFFCQGLYGEYFVVLTNMLKSTGGSTVMVTWYNWDSVSSMRLVEYAE